MSHSGFSSCAFFAALLPPLPAMGTSPAIPVAASVPVMPAQLLPTNSHLYGWSPVMSKKRGCCFTDTDRLPQ